MGNPAEETYRYPNKSLFSTANSRSGTRFVNELNRGAIVLHAPTSLKGGSRFFYAELRLSSPSFCHLKTRCATG